MPVFKGCLRGCFWVICPTILGAVIGAILGGAVFTQFIGPPTDDYAPGDGLGLMFGVTLGAILGFGIGICSGLYFWSRTLTEEGEE